MSPSTHVAVDEKLLLALFRIEDEDDLEFLAEAIVGYLEDAPKHLKKIPEALSHCDPATVQQAAHTLKSTSANFGAKPLAELCKHLESLARTALKESDRGEGATTDWLSAAQEMLSKIVAEYDRVQTALKQLKALEDLPSASSPRRSRLDR